MLVFGPVEVPTGRVLGDHLVERGPVVTIARDRSPRSAAMLRPTPSAGVAWSSTQVAGGWWRSPWPCHRARTRPWTLFDGAVSALSSASSDRGWRANRSVDVSNGSLSWLTFGGCEPVSLSVFELSMWRAAIGQHPIDTLDTFDLGPGRAGPFLELVELGLLVGCRADERIALRQGVPPRCSRSLGRGCTQSVRN